MTTREELTVEQEEKINRLVALGFKELPVEDRDRQCRKCWKAGGLVFKDYDDRDCHEDVQYLCVICNKGWIA